MVAAVTVIAPRLAGVPGNLGRLWDCRCGDALEGQSMSDFWIGGPFRTDQRVVVLGQGSKPKPRTDRDGAPKCAPDGRVTYSTGTTALVQDDEGEFVPGRMAITVHVIEPADRYGKNAVQSSAFMTDGVTWVTPYVANGFTALSIVTERLVPYSPEGAGRSAGKGAAE